MESISFKLFAPVLLSALLILVLSTTATCEEMSKTMYVIEKLAIVEPKANLVKTGNQQKPEMMMQALDQDKQQAYAASTTAMSTTQSQSILSCSKDNGYCSLMFGVECCAGLLCYEAPFGGVCHKSS